MRLGISLALTQLMGGSFSPLTLFAASEVGAWYDPSDLTTVFQDSAGTVPGAVGSVVGRINDKSGRGNHATQSTTASKPILRQSGAKYYLEFDGVDDFLVTSAINFTATDKVSVFAGVRKLSDAATGVVAELSTSVSATAGSWGLFAPPAANARYAYGTGGTADVFAETTSVYASPHTSVLSGVSDISAPSAVLRINGAQIASNAATQGTGNFGNHALYIGRRGGTSLPFNGNLYSLVIRGAASTAAQITSTETYVTGKTV